MRPSLRAAAAALLLALGSATDAAADPESEYSRAVELYDAGRWREAASVCQRLIDAQPDFAKPYYLKAWMLSQQGEPARAARVYLDLLGRAPAELDARLYYARILLYDLRRFGDAEREFRSALAYAREGDARRVRAEEGLAAVARERARRRLFREQYDMLGWVLAGLAALWLGIAVGGAWLTRPRPEGAPASEP
jgi:tetratricopeptide (TPR) repeat protein